MKRDYHYLMVKWTQIPVSEMTSRTQNIRRRLAREPRLKKYLLSRKADLKALYTAAGTPVAGTLK